MSCLRWRIIMAPQREGTTKAVVKVAGATAEVETQWYEFDDARVMSLGVAYVVTADAYVLFYRRV